MNDKILESYIADFAKRNALPTSGLPVHFRQFVNHCVVACNTTDSFDVVDICTEGGGDCGIDGFALLVEGHLVFSQDEIDFYRDKLRRLNAEFVFIQSKSGPSFSTSDLGTFLFGIKSFFGIGGTLASTSNDSIKDAHELKEYIYERSIDMDRPPVCSLYFASSGEWKDDPNLVHRAETEIAPLKASSLFSDVRFTPLDAARLRSLYRRTLRAFGKNNKITSIGTRTAQ